MNSSDQCKWIVKEKPLIHASDIYLSKCQYIPVISYFDDAKIYYDDFEKVHIPVCRFLRAVPPKNVPGGGMEA